MQPVSLIIDNIAGFDVAAMAKLSEKEFLDLHKENTDINYGKTPTQVTKWLKDAYKAIKAKAADLPKEEEEPKAPEEK